MELHCYKEINNAFQIVIRVEKKIKQENNVE